MVGVDPVPLIREYDEEHGPPGSMRAAQIFEPATPIKIREPRNLHLGRVLAVALLAVARLRRLPPGLHARRALDGEPRPAATIRPGRDGQAEATTKPVTHTTAPPKDEAVIRLTAISDCWVGLNSPTGQSLYQGTVPAGPTMTWDEKNPVSMVIGNPPGVKLTVNGKHAADEHGQRGHAEHQPVEQDPGHGRLSCGASWRDR